MTSEEIKKNRELQTIKISFNPIIGLLDDPDITSIFIAQNGTISFRKFGCPIEDYPGTISEDIKSSMLTQIANFNNTVINKEKYPVFEGSIPVYNARITGIFPPVASSGIDIAIRKPPTKIYTLEEYVASGKLSVPFYEKIKYSLENKHNIMISGGTNTGKTTFFNACLHYLDSLDPTKRLYILQDTAELISHAKYASFITSSDKSLFPKLIEASLRFEPDRIHFGEIRDGNVMNTFLIALNTGHKGGIATIHSNSAELTMLRVYQLLKQVIIGDVLEIRDMIDTIIHLSRDVETGVKVTSVMETAPYSNEFVKAGFQEALKALEGKDGYI